MDKWRASERGLKFLNFKALNVGWDSCGIWFSYLFSERYGLNNFIKVLSSWNINWFSSLLFITTDTSPLGIANLVNNHYCLETFLEESKKLQTFAST